VLAEPFGRLPYFLQVCGRLFLFIIDNKIKVTSAVDEYVFRKPSNKLPRAIQPVLQVTS